MENLDILVKELCKYPTETQWLEFKHNNCEPNMIGEDISALANSAVLADRDYAYMIWGVDDNNHKLIGTSVRLKQEKKETRKLRIGFGFFFLIMLILNFLAQTSMVHM